MTGSRKAWRVVVVDRDSEWVAGLERTLRDALQLVATTSVLEAQALAHAIDVLVLDLNAPGVQAESIAELARSFPGVAIVVTSKTASVGEAVNAMKSGASDYLAKPIEPERLLHAVQEAARRRPPRNFERADGGMLTYREMLKLTGASAAREYLKFLMKSSAGNVTRAAERAGLRRESLHRLLRRHRVESD
jgi:DNA-binding NtrC family response regulator